MLRFRKLEQNTNVYSLITGREGGRTPYWYMSRSPFSLPPLSPPLTFLSTTGSNSHIVLKIFRCIPRRGHSSHPRRFSQWCEGGKRFIRDSYRQWGQNFVCDAWKATKWHTWFVNLWAKKTLLKAAKSVCESWILLKLMREMGLQLPLCYPVVAGRRKPQSFLGSMSIHRAIEMTNIAS